MTLVDREAVLHILVDEIDGDWPSFDVPLTRALDKVRALPSVEPGAAPVSFTDAQVEAVARFVCRGIERCSCASSSAPACEACNQTALAILNAALGVKP